MSPDLHDRLPDSAYVHRTAALELSGTLDPDTARKRLTGRARRELRSRADGQIVDLMAGQADQSGDRVWAVVLGRTGLHIASAASEPRTWTFSSWRFQPGSMTTVTRAFTADAAEPAEADPDPQDGGEPLLARSLNEEIRGFLGHLPAPVQVSIQQPFRHGPDLTTFRWYLGDIEQVDRTWRFWCYLTDNTTLVYASGSRQPASSPGAGLTRTAHCHQAAIA